MTDMLPLAALTYISCPTGAGGTTLDDRMKRVDDLSEAEAKAVLKRCIDMASRTLYAMTHDGKCPTEGCLGDERYAAPGRGHIDTCTYPSETGWTCLDG